jgi:hypothetical protein
MRFLAEFPCPRCWINKSYIDMIGTVVDRARRFKLRKDGSSRRSTLATVFDMIFIHGRALGAAAITQLLQPYSWIPVQASTLKTNVHVSMMTLCYAECLL